MVATVTGEGTRERLHAEVTVRWGGRTRVEVRRVAPGERLDAGGAAGTLPVGHGLSALGRFGFVEQGETGSMVRVPRGCEVRSLGDVAIGDAGGPSEEADGDGLPGRRIGLVEGQGIRVGFGALDVEVRATRAAPVLGRPWREQVDLAFGTRLVILVLVAVTFQRAVAITDFGGDGIDHTMSSAPLNAVNFAPAAAAKPPESFPLPKLVSQLNVDGAVPKAPSKQAGAKKTEAEKRRAIQDKGLLKLLSMMGGPSAGVFASGGPGANVMNALNGLQPGGGRGDTAGLDGVGSRTGPGGGPGGGPMGIGDFTGGPSRGGPTCDGDCALGGPSGLKKAEATFKPQRVKLEGALSAEVVGRVIRRHWNEVKACYERRLQADPNLSGKVGIRFVIGPAGTVGEAAASENDTGDDELASCISAKVLGWVFPAPMGGGVVEVNYPFLLQAAH